MLRKLASIQTIEKIDPIQGADMIELATVLGWHVIVRKGEYIPGDRVVYVEIDSVLPERPEFEFLRDRCFINKHGFRGFRIRTLKMRGVVSQGIIFPMSILPDSCYELGEDVTAVLGVQKYEIPDTIIQPKCSGFRKRGNFPRFIPKTDEIRIQSVPQVLERHRGKHFYATEKFDGTSMTVYRDAETGLHVCSRNFDLVPDDVHKYNGTAYWDVAKRDKLEDLLKVLGNVALQGELIGPGIQENRYGLTDHKYLVFNVWDIDNQQYFERDVMEDMIDGLGLSRDFIVPRVYDFTLDHTVDDIIEMSRGRSTIADVPREGIVVRPWEEQRDPDLGRLSFKAINPDFLLRYGL